MSSNMIFIPQSANPSRGGIIAQPTLDQIRLLNHFDSGLSQPAQSFSAKGPHITRTGYSQNSTEKKFGFSSVFNLSPDNGPYLQATTNTGSDAFGAGDFTIELWIKPTLLNRVTLHNAIFHITGACAGFVTRQGALGFITHDADALQALTPDGVIKENIWQHVAWVRRGTKLTLWVEGLELANIDIGNKVFAGSTTFYLGYMQAIGANGYGYYTGAFDELRMVKGLAVYTENFDVPTEAFVIPPN